MTVLEIAGEMALCRDPDGERTEVDVALVDTVAPGDGVLVHAGVALARLEAAA